MTHNAYAYTYNGKSANDKLYKKGSKVKVIGSIKLKGKKYNIISGNVYINASNFAKRRSRNVLGDGYETQLLHNSYVYNAKGQRIKGTKLRKGHSVTCYGNPIRIHGKKYVQIGNGQFVRSSNVLLSYNGPTGSDSLNHTHHNASSNTSSTTKQINSNSSNSTTNNGSNSSSNQSNSSST
nr:SLAP domain-containing protein [Lactobacillus crispatus]